MLRLPISKVSASAGHFARPLALISALGLILLVLLAPVTSRAQATGPLSPATPSDQPVASAAPAPQATAANRIGGKPNLSGTWKLNKDQSDDPREKMRQAAQQSGNDPDASQGPRGGNGGPGGGFGYPGGRGPYGGGPYGGPNGQNGPYGGANGDPNAAPNNDPNAGPNGAPNDPNQNGPSPSGRGGPRQDDLAQLTIEQTATSAKISGASGRLLAAYAATPQDAPSADTDSNAGGNGRRRNRMAPAVAQWQGDQLVATNQMGGASMARTYELSPDGRQLYVTTKMENRRSNTPVTYRQVYDPVTVSNDGKNQ